MQELRGTFHHAVGDRDRRHLENVDHKNDVEQLVAGMRPGFLAGKIQLQRVRDIGHLIFPRHPHDVFQGMFVEIGGMEAQVRKVRREVVDVHAAGEFQP